jgi:hypothetical protein
MVMKSAKASLIARRYLGLAFLLHPASVDGEALALALEAGLNFGIELRRLVEGGVYRS